MNKIRRISKKDRYGVIRGSFVLGLLLLLCVGAFAFVIVDIGISFEMERAMDATAQVTTRFEQLIDGNREHLEGVSVLLEEDNAHRQEILSSIVEHGPFNDAGLYNRGMIYRANGEKSEYTLASRDAVSLAENGMIQFCVPSADESVLLAWLGMEQAEAVLESAFEAAYDYVVYDSATGEYLINHSRMAEGGYYDALLKINEHGAVEDLLNSASAQARIHSEGTYYIAQQGSSIGTWSVSLILPEHLIREGIPNMRFLSSVCIAAAMMLIAALACYTVFIHRRVQVAGKNALRALNAGERMMDVVARDSHNTLFVYNRVQDLLMGCYDGMGLLRQTENTVLRSMRDVALCCGMNEADMDRIQSVLHEMKMGDEREFLIRCASENQDERTLRFAFYASPEDERNLICSVSDRTQELESRDRAEVERSYQASMQNKARSIWQINISRNRWGVLFCKKSDIFQGVFGGKKILRDYNADLGSALREYLHPADYEEYAQIMSIVSIASMFRAGRSEFTQDYRVRGRNAGEYEWHRMCVRIWLHPESNDILANLYVYNVDAEKNAELERGERKRILRQALTAIGGIYSGLYYVDLENDLCYTARSLGGDLETQLCVPYKSTFDEYISNTVHADDRECIRNLLSAYYLRRNMTEGSHFRRKEFRRRIDDDYAKAAIIVQPARFENGCVKEVVLAFRYFEHENESRES